MYPIGLGAGNGAWPTRPKVVCHYLLEKMRNAGVCKAYIILREGKWDIPAYLRDGTIFDMHLAYLMLGVPFGVPYTVDQAYPFVKENLVAFGFPDVLFNLRMPFCGYSPGKESTMPMSSWGYSRVIAQRRLIWLM